MAHKRISLTICETCKKFGIDYIPSRRIFFDDAKRLGEIYRDLKIISGDLYAISERHDIPELKVLLEDIKKIDLIEHNIISVAKRIKDE